MNPITVVCLFVGLLALTCANMESRSDRRHRIDNSIKHNFSPADWISMMEIQSLPSMQEVTIEKLEEMSLSEGAQMMEKLYHISQAKQPLKATMAPKASEISVISMGPHNEKMTFKLSEWPRKAMEEQYYGNHELTIYITGLPETTETVKKATRKMMEAYMQRYSNRQTAKYDKISDNDRRKEKEHSSSEENEMNNDDYASTPTGKFIIIEMGNLLSNMHQHTIIDIEKTGMVFGDMMMQMIDMTNMPYDMIHIIGSNIGAHIAGAAGRYFTKKTGHQIKRITGLDPSKIFTHTHQALKGLARGDAEFVDVIHTSAYGMGTPARSGDADFYPNGPSEGVSGANNVIEAAMRAVRYFAESVKPGHERDFPAVRAISMQEYKNYDGNGKQAYMGIYTSYDTKGDFMLQVNSMSPFGRMMPAYMPRTYHTFYKPMKADSADPSNRPYKSGAH